jgi:S-ribosylhomocysteine lyase
MKEIKRIASFSVDHTTLTPGIYVSRVDGDVVTYDLRTRVPNSEELMDHETMHTVEHMLATFLRNSAIADDVIYFGPMGCRTGFYLLLAGDFESKDIVPLMVEMWEFIRDFKDEVPGASAKDCGNYLDMNLGMANYLAKKYLNEVLYDIKEDRLVYPE